MWKFIISVLLATTTWTGAIVSAGEAVEGRWLTQGKSAVVEIYRCAGDELCGRLLWFRVKPTDPDPQIADIHNPDPALRSRPLCGLVIIWGLRPESSVEWSGGSLYDPETGNTYSGKIALNPDGTLGLRGYIGISLFGRTEVWSRFTQALRPCPSE